MKLGNIASSTAVAVQESCQAWQAADDLRSAVRLSADFLLSRLLKFRLMPGRDQSRQARIRGLQIIYRFNRGDIQSLREVLIEEAYQLPFPLETRNAIDLGANIGLWSLWLQRSQPSLQKVVAVEPDPANADLARKNFAACGVSGSVIESAAGGERGAVFFERRSESNLGGIASPDSQQNRERIGVRLLPVADLIAAFPASLPIDLIKMDIEGSEHSVLSGDLSWLDRVRALIIEWHPEKCDPLPLLARLEDRGFRHFPANTHRQSNLSAFLKLA